MRLVSFSTLFGLFAFASGACASTNVVLNSGFELPAGLIPGQTDVGVGQTKLLFQSTSVPGFANGINSVPNWTNSFTNVGFGAGLRDAGLSRAGFGGAGTSRYAFINNWETRLSQTTPLTVQPGQTYQATIQVGMSGTAKGGRFQLWAGTPSSTNPDLFSGSAVMLDQVTAASLGYTVFTPQVLVPLNTWTTLTINYTAPATGPMLNQPLTVSFMTSTNSVGAVFWDNVSVTVVPEPSTFALIGLGSLLARRRR